MKKTNFNLGSLIVLLVSFIFLSSCSSEEDNNIRKQDYSSSYVEANSFIERYYLVHNSSLDDYFIYLNEYSDKLLFSKGTESKLDNTTIFMTNYLSEKMDKDISLEEVKSFYKSYETFNYKETKMFEEITTSYYYKELMNLLSNENISLSFFKQKTNSLLSTLEKDNSFSEESKIAIKSSILIAKESLSYWSENESDWIVFSDNREMLNRKKPKDNRKGDIARADAQGAISGAITGAFTGGPMGAAVGAMLGAPWSSAVAGAWKKAGFF